jgi:hypothetical protein
MLPTTPMLTPMLTMLTRGTPTIPRSTVCTLSCPTTLGIHSPKPRRRSSNTRTATAYRGSFTRSSDLSMVSTISRCAAIEMGRLESVARVASYSAKAAPRRMGARLRLCSRQWTTRIPKERGYRSQAEIPIGLFFTTTPLQRIPTGCLLRGGRR